ncbi:anoctamin-9 [Eublepharis macularius]|uniref:Anoctamin n=1 Tax=Eublepharis macularius TaxID=481883 RepID=A0AA97J0A1_EUBMA|nr:anoctamin-9 [Eublepharis macularius]
MQDNSVWVPMRDHPSEDVDALIPPSQMPNKWDFVLVCDDHKPLSTKKSKEEEFLEELRKKKLIVETIKDKKLFHGIRAQSSIIQKYKCLLSDPDYELDYLNTQPEDEQQGMTCTRIRIVNFILQNTDISSKQNFQDLMKENVFETAFPLHERKKNDTFLKINWRSIHNTHLIEELRMYSGEKVALYFAWLSWYTYVLLIAAVPGIILVIYGFMSFNSSQVSQEICAANTTIMCPLCDQKCPFWPLSDTCTYAKLTHLFDNEGTVLFAIFMAVWATVYLELWKRQRAKVVSEWNLYWWDEEKDDLAMELISNPKGREIRMYQHSYVRTTIVLILFTLMICVLIGIAHAIVLYRVVVTVLFAQSNSGFFRERATTMAVVTGAVLHYLSIIIMSKVNRHVAVFLCDLEKPRTFSERENNFTVKIFILQFFTHFSSLIYVAFFLGRINGHPGNYVRVAGKWRLEECHPSGCLLDLFIQMAIIMTLKQTLSHLQEYLLPWIKCQCRKLCAKPKSHSRVHMEESAQNQCKDEWLQNYQLNEVDIFSLFNEFLEMMIQYSFTTIFVAAFPLAPLLAFFNNLIEIRYDAVKMAKLQRRMVPRKAKDIGIWLQVVEAIGILAVIANGLVISITSDFIPMQVYKYTRGPCMQKNYTGIDCFTGYVNHSLSVFSIQDFENRDELPVLKDSMGNKITHCRYRDYRNSDDYSYSVEFWHVFAARLSFLIVFEHVALCIKLIAAWFVPDVPRRIKNLHLKQKCERLRKQLSEMDNSTEV